MEIPCFSEVTLNYWLHIRDELLVLSEWFSAVVYIYPICFNMCANCLFECAQALLTLIAFSVC